MSITVATSAYQIQWLDDWSSYRSKLMQLVEQAAEGGANLAVFPEYAAMELASLAGAETAGDLEGSLHAVADRVEEADALHAELAKEHGLYILAGSAPVFDHGDRPVNRTRFFSPRGETGHQDKQIMTRFEREEWDVVSGGPLRIFETEFGKVGILICYDSQFPLLAREMSDCDIILVPSCTDSLAGYWRVRTGAMARALENQCITIMSSTVGDVSWSPAVDENVGAGGVFCPPDTGWIETGTIACGELNKPGWTFAELDLSSVRAVRADGNVLNRKHWAEQIDKTKTVEVQKL